MKCLAIDDEPVALSIIEQYCRRRGNVELETFTSPRLAMQRLHTWRPDVVLLDIELNGASGIELAREIPASVCLIFTTAFAQYALDGFEVNAVDFLHKPYFYDRFDRAMQKAEKWLKMNDLLSASSAPERQIVVKVEYKNVSIGIDSIVFVEAVDNYVKIHTDDGASVLSKMTMQAISRLLPSAKFVRIHRSYIVDSKRIARFSRTEVVLAKSGIALPIGKTYADAALEFFQRR